MSSPRNARSGCLGGSALGAPTRAWSSAAAIQTTTRAARRRATGSCIRCALCLRARSEDAEARVAARSSRVFAAARRVASTPGACDRASAASSSPTHSPCSTSVRSAPRSPGRAESASSGSRGRRERGGGALKCRCGRRSCVGSKRPVGVCDSAALSGEWAQRPRGNRNHRLYKSACGDQPRLVPDCLTAEVQVTRQ